MKLWNLETGKCENTHKLITRTEIHEDDGRFSGVLQLNDGRFLVTTTDYWGDFPSERWILS